MPLNGQLTHMSGKGCGSTNHTGKAGAEELNTYENILVAAIAFLHGLTWGLSPKYFCNSTQRQSSADHGEQQRGAPPPVCCPAGQSWTF